MNDVKLAVLGGEGTGKSALTVRFLTKRFIGEYASNFESIYNKHLYLEGKQLNLEIYDPCSQKAKCSLASELHWADGFVIVYDISDRSSFASAKALIYRIREPPTSHCKRAVESAVLLVGNKQDLCHVREVGWEEGRKLALDNRCQFCELSAAEQSLEVETMFIRIIKDILTNFKLKEKRRSSGSKSMAKLINNVFGKRRKSV
ncbi:ras-related and estrogen-regulated growth inhibitor-like protein [Manis pentadactyla]|uniref:ras-related and estrogen-regulated growth inhibitor-like protein n=1 Tax=Manis pentadactyla TaxID=143292 RepID=UPI00255C30EC|nr:ras-related and estrogen-regulated growth inhibitor-like protein [Manis pentadactyla]KAI5158863.1 Ras-Related And Estrogen-Regulated Growth Inhibitor-Like Protein [Manis pentadactyla]